MKLRWLGNACLEVLFSDKNLLIDPNYLVEPKEEPDFVLLSHEHDDHFDLEKFNGLSNSINLFGPSTALEKFDVDGSVIGSGDVVEGFEAISCDCYGSEECLCFYGDGLLHTADKSNFPVREDVRVLFSACFKELYDDYVEGAKKIDPDIVFPYHYDPREELNLAKGLQDRLLEEDIKCEILEVGETVELSN